MGVIVDSDAYRQASDDMRNDPLYWDLLVGLSD